MVIKAVSLAVVTILLSAVIVGAMSADNDAAAKPMKLNPAHKYSKWYNNKVCGDKLCEGTPVYKVPVRTGKSSPNR